MTSIRLCVLAAIFCLSGCAVWSYEPLVLPEAFKHVETQEIRGVEVSVAIPSAEQANRHFGVDLDERNLQAIWLRIRNSTDFTFWHLRTALDMDIYSADEVARMFASQYRDTSLDGLRQHLRDESLRVRVPAQTETEGFVFVPKVYGGRYVDIRLLQDIYEVAVLREADTAATASDKMPVELEMRFEYTIPLPDGMFDFEGLNEAQQHANQKPAIVTREALRAALEGLSCCSADAAGDGNGDPLNIVIVASGENILHSLARAGWSFTHRITLKSVTTLVGAALSNKPYPVAPVSDLFLFGRKQDFALQRPRANITQRNHMRLWLAPFRYESKSVWVGQISRDIGIKLTSKSTTPTTHIIDPEVDLAREYLLQSLLSGGFVDMFGFVAGATAATPEDPAYNLVGDPYFSDGRRLVVFLSPHPKPYSAVRSLMWERSDGAISEGQSPAAADKTKSLHRADDALPQ